jgi:hypothetical protein
VNWAFFGAGVLTGWLWLLAGFYIAVLLGRRLERRAGDQPVPGADQAIALTEPARERPFPDHVTWNKPPPPGPALNPDEAGILTALYKGRAAAPAASVQAAQVIADGLRIRFPGVDDTTLGLVTLDLFGYVRALGLGLPDPLLALQSVLDGFGFAAEELTRLARNEVPR